MKILNHWEQALGQKTESIQRGQMPRILLNDGNEVLQLETNRESVIVIVDSTADPQTLTNMDFSKLYGLTIKKLIVPMYDEDYHEDTTIVVGFDRGPDVWLVPDDVSSHIRIT